MFWKKPDAQTRKVYQRQFEHLSHVFSYVIDNNALPPRDGEEKNSLSNQENREELVTAVIAVLREAKFDTLNSSDRSQFLTGISRHELEGGASVAQFMYEAIMIITLMNTFETILVHQKDMFPNYHPLSDIVSRIGFVLPRSMKVIFENTMPEMICQTFPNFRDFLFSGSGGNWTEGIGSEIDVENGNAKCSDVDIMQAIRIVEEFYSSMNELQQNDLEWAANLLDEDVFEEVKIAAGQIHEMWSKFEVKFGHRGAARSKEEATFRNHILRASSVRIIRATDEQFERLGMQKWLKPNSWETHFNSGDIGLPKAPWE